MNKNQLTCFNCCKRRNYIYLKLRFKHSSLHFNILYEYFYKFIKWKCYKIVNIILLYKIRKDFKNWKWQIKFMLSQPFILSREENIKLVIPVSHLWSIMSHLWVSQQHLLYSINKHTIYLFIIFFLVFVSIIKFNKRSFHIICF